MTTSAMTAGPLDEIDLAMLRELSAEGRITETDLAGRVGLSKSPAQVRL